MRLYFSVLPLFCSVVFRLETTKLVLTELLCSAMSSASGSGGVHSAVFDAGADVPGLQFPIPDDLTVGLHDHLAGDEFDAEHWHEVGNRWRVLCRRYLAYVSHQAGGSLRWMKELAAQQPETLEIYVETLSGKSITLPYYHSDLKQGIVSVQLIKKRIQQLEAIPIYQQQLMLNDRLLHDYDRLDDYHKLEGSSLHLVVLSNASSQCKCPHDLDAADMMKMYWTLEYYEFETLTDLVAILRHRLWFMSQLGPDMLPTISQKMEHYARQQTDWWGRATGSQCRWQGKRERNIIFKRGDPRRYVCREWKEHDILPCLRCILYADVQTLHAAVAEYDRISDAAKKKFQGYTKADFSALDRRARRAAERKELHSASLEYDRETTRGYCVMEQMLVDAQILPREQRSADFLTNKYWGTPPHGWADQQIPEPMVIQRQALAAGLRMQRHTLTYSATMRSCEKEG